MGKGRFVNQKLAKRTGFAQRREQSRANIIPGSGKSARAIMKPLGAPRNPMKDRNPS